MLAIFFLILYLLTMLFPPFDMARVWKSLDWSFSDGVNAGFLEKLHSLCFVSSRDRCPHLSASDQKWKGYLVHNTTFFRLRLRKIFSQFLSNTMVTFLLPSLLGTKFCTDLFLLFSSLCDVFRDSSPLNLWWFPFDLFQIRSSPFQVVLEWFVFLWKHLH